MHACKCVPWLYSYNSVEKYLSIILGSFDVQTLLQVREK